MRLRRLVTFAAGGAVAALLVSACKPKPGAKCGKEGETVCAGDKAALICSGEKWVALACRGLSGCIASSCSNEGFFEGEPCIEDGASSCRADGKAMLKCAARRWAKTSDCRGPRGCAGSASGASCDMATAEPGDLCSPDNEGNGACSVDKKELLVCTGGKMSPYTPCRGPNGCRPAGAKLDCDTTIGRLGDACHPDGDTSCSEDKQQQLKCAGATVTLDKPCPRGCRVVSNESRCN